MTAFVLYVALLTLALVLLVVVGYMLAPRRPGKVKERRFEAGNPPYGEVKRRLVVQYVGYIYMATAFEAVAGLLIVAALIYQWVTPELALTLAVVLALSAIYVARYLAVISDVKRWS
ncbi:MAG: NADH-quinone oxidoreductase subunit A [Pyrobaculum sp.]